MADEAEKQKKARTLSIGSAAALFGPGPSTPSDPFSSLGPPSTSDDPFSSLGGIAEEAEPEHADEPSGGQPGAEDPFPSHVPSATPDDLFSSLGPPLTANDPFSLLGGIAEEAEPERSDEPSGGKPAAEDTFPSHMPSATSDDPFSSLAPPSTSDDPFSSLGPPTASDDPFSSLGPSTTSNDPYSTHGGTVEEAGTYETPYAQAGNWYGPIQGNVEAHSQEDPYGQQGDWSNSAPADGEAQPYETSYGQQGSWATEAQPQESQYQPYENPYGQQGSGYRAAQGSGEVHPQENQYEQLGDWSNSAPADGEARPYETSYGQQGSWAAEAQPQESQYQPYEENPYGQQGSGYGVGQGSGEVHPQENQYGQQGDWSNSAPADGEARPYETSYGQQGSWAGEVQLQKSQYQPYEENPYGQQGSGYDASQPDASAPAPYGSPPAKSAVPPDPLGHDAGAPTTSFGLGGEVYQPYDTQYGQRGSGYEEDPYGQQGSGYEEDPYGQQRSGYGAAQEPGEVHLQENQYGQQGDWSNLAPRDGEARPYETPYGQQGSWTGEVQPQESSYQPYENTYGQQGHGHGPAYLDASPPTLYSSPPAGSAAAPDQLRRDAGDTVPSYGLGGEVVTFSPPSPIAQVGGFAVDKSAPAPYSSPPAGSGVPPDPLRRNTRVPVVSFGFGGKLVTFFPSSSITQADGFGGYTIAPGGGSSTTLSMRPIADVVQTSAFASTFDVGTFPGPAFMEGGSQPSALMTRAAGVGVVGGGGKAKKTLLMKHLEERIDEMSKGLGYLRRRRSTHGLAADGAVGYDAAAEEGINEWRRSNDRIVLLKLLVVMLENDGQLGGHPQLDASIRFILAPEASDTADLNLTSSTQEAYSITPAGRRSLSDDTASIKYEVRSSHVDRIQALLLRGERRAAVDFAVQEKLWSHALIISSALDKESWKNVTNAFIRHELGSAADGSPQSVRSNGRESLRVAYSLFSGQGASAVHQLTQSSNPSNPPHSARPGGFLSPAVWTPLPVSPAFKAEHYAPDGNVSASLKKWREAAATILANRTAGDSIALTSLGDMLVQGGWIEAGHVCYLLSMQTSPLGGADVPNVRLVVLGTDHPKRNTTFHRDMDGILMSEVLEFALSLAPATKGQEPFTGLPHLQAYRLVHAWELAELGYVSEAQKYCEAIAGTLKAGKHSPYYHPALLKHLKDLSDRIVGTPHLDKSGSWITRKMQRPTLDNLWGALEGRFTKFIAGDEDGAQVEKSSANGAGGAVQPAVSAFSHFSAITPQGGSGTLSRSQSQADFAQGGPSRTTSAMSQHRPPPGSNYPESVAEESLNPYESSSSDAYVHSTSAADTEGPYPGTNATSDTPWWAGGSNGEATGGDGAGRPTTYLVSNPGAELPDTSGFISPMAALSKSTTPVPASTHAYGRGGGGARQSNDADNFDDDLGLGNSKSKPSQGQDEKNVSQTDHNQGEAKEKQEEKKPELKQTSSWLGRWWGSRRASADMGDKKAVKAHLGEETTFYYDSELKRWAGGDATAASTPPPPPRAQTVSPSMTRPNLNNTPGMPPRMVSAGPMGRPATPPMLSGANGGDAPPLPPMPSPGAPPPRARSNLADPNLPPASQPPPLRAAASTSALGPSGTPGLGPPPAGNRKPSGGAKKSVRSRYIDIMNNPQ